MHKIEGRGYLAACINFVAQVFWTKEEETCPGGEASLPLIKLSFQCAAPPPHCVWGAAPPLVPKAPLDLSLIFFMSPPGLL